MRYVLRVKRRRQDHNSRTLYCFDAEDEKLRHVPIPIKCTSCRCHESVYLDIHTFRRCTSFIFDCRSALRMATRTKGTLYLNKHGYEERASIIPLHDEAAGIIVAEKCCEKCFATWPSGDEDAIPRHVAYCRQARQMYDGYGFEDLMNTTFGLLPAGASPGTHRLAEASDHSDAHTSPVTFC